MEYLKISTITSILKLSNPIDLKGIYDTIPISQYIPFIEYGANRYIVKVNAVVMRGVNEDELQDFADFAIEPISSLFSSLFLILASEFL